FNRMLTTTLAVVALAGALSTGASPSPSLQTNYTQALSAASAEHKPMAVFIGHDAAKVKQMISDGTIPTDAAKLLRENYVCVALDARAGEGKKLSDSEKMTSGLIISSSSGNIQALRHSPTVSGADLTRQLVQFAHGAAAAPTTVLSGCATGNCPLRATTVPG